MSLLAETVVEEWLNQQGYFTIRGIRTGVDEIDLLAVNRDGDCRHVEVTASTNPISYLTPLPRSVREATGRGANSARHRSEDELSAGAKEWIDRKFRQSRKAQIRDALHAGPWKFEFVLHRVRHQEELPHIVAEGVSIIWLSDIVRDLRRRRRFTAAGRDLVELVNIELTDEIGTDTLPGL